jgi:hypothetical protein
MAITSETSKLKSLASKEVSIYHVIDSIATDETKSDAIEVALADAVSIVVITSTGVSSGVVEIEGTIESDYAGAWQSLGSITTSAASTTYIKSVALANAAAALPVPYIRAHISTVIGGGTVDVYLVVRR